MSDNLYYNTVTPLLLSVLKQLMEAKEFKAFRLVGGTALSLHRGHRESVDIDLFTDATYNSIDFKAIETYLRANYNYVDTSSDNIIGFGKSYFVGESAQQSIKLDLFYTDAFIYDAIVINNIRLASVEEIIAMKMEVISRGGRKKDFWDLHELANDYAAETMFLLHQKRYPYTHNKAILKNNFSQFQNADEDFDPVCLRGKHWQLIKLDLIEFVKHNNF